MSYQLVTRDLGKLKHTVSLKPLHRQHPGVLSSFATVDSVGKCILGRETCIKRRWLSHPRAHIDSFASSTSIDSD